MGGIDRIGVTTCYDGRAASLGAKLIFIELIARPTLAALAENLRAGLAQQSLARLPDGFARLAGHRQDPCASAGRHSDWPHGRAALRGHCPRVGVVAVLARPGGQPVRPAEAQNIGDFRCSAVNDRANRLYCVAKRSLLCRIGVAAFAGNFSDLAEIFVGAVLYAICSLRSLDTACL